MFSTDGIDQATRAAQRHEEAVALKASMKSERDHRAQVGREKWWARLVTLWEEFTQSAEYLSLIEGLDQMSVSELRIHDRLEFHVHNTEKPFVTVYVSGGYFSTRSVTPHSPKGYFSSIHEFSSSPEEIFEVFLCTLDRAFEREKHAYRFKHDGEYRKQCVMQEEERQRQERGKLLLLITLVVAVGWFFIS